MKLTATEDLESDHIVFTLSKIDLLELPPETGEAIAKQWKEEAATIGDKLRLLAVIADMLQNIYDIKNQ